MERLLLDPDDPIVDACTCPICYELILRAVIFHPCGHSLCQKCETIIYHEYGSWCPICKQIVASCTRNRLVETLTGGLKCYCPNKSPRNKNTKRNPPFEYCQKIITVDDKERHLKVCEFTVVPCRFSDNGCEQCILRKDIQEHERNCKHNKFFCPNPPCSVFLKEEEIAEHCKVCPFEVVQCCASNYGCFVKVQRGSLQAHHSICPVITKKLVHDDIRAEIASLAEQVHEILQDEPGYEPTPLNLGSASKFSTEIGMLDLME